MTYGLVPRVIPSTGAVHWDDPQLPVHDIAQGVLVSTYKYPEESEAVVRANRHHVQDYASLRGKAMVTVFFERWLTKDDEEARGLLGDKEYREWRQRDAYFRCQRLPGKEDEFCFQIWGHRLTLRPGPFPISESGAQCETLSWPGIPAPVSGDGWRRFGSLDFVYVRDDVLGRFEGRPEYKIEPASGTVSYGGQWAVDFCNRIGRDTLRLEIKKLYEGAPPWVVRLYHGSAIQKPVGKAQQLKSERNVGVRAKEIVYGMADLGEALSTLVSATLGEPVAASQMVGLDRARLESSGWWNASSAEPIGHHIPMSLTASAFLSRCKDLTRLIIESLDLGLLRRTLTALGADPKVKQWGSLKCLDYLLQLVQSAHKGGLSLVSDRAEVLNQFTPQERPTPLSYLFALYDLRVLDSHRPGTAFDEALSAGLTTFGIDPTSTAAGYGAAADAVYDRLASCLEAARETIHTAG